MSADSQRLFQERFWADKNITAEEYFRRLNYIDSTFGSSKTGSGANTDQGRVYLSLGAPNRVARFASSRIFVPLEIWYYDAIPSIHLTTELRLIFYQKNAVGIPRLYSPTLDTIRALLLPEAGTVGMFGPNDNLTESSIRQNLMVGPGEDEIITASAGVASGVKATGNDEILAQIMSPDQVLARGLREQVESRLVFSRPHFNVIQTPSPFGGYQVDLQFQTEYVHSLALTVNQGVVPLYETEIRSASGQPQAIQFLHRLDLLPGSYTVLFSIDGQKIPFPLTVSAGQKPDKIYRANSIALPLGKSVPFQFGNSQLQLDPEGSIAVLPVTKPSTVTWTIRQGFRLIARASTEAQGIAQWQMPLSELSGGPYSLEASSSDGDFKTDLDIPLAAAPQPPGEVISYNANLAPALRYANIAHQYLLRGDVSSARQNLLASFRAGHTEEAEIESARADVLDGDLDSARDRLRRVLATKPDNFQALSVLAYIEAKFQDYPLAASLYQKALTIQDSPAIRQALASLPTQ